MDGLSVECGKFRHEDGAGKVGTAIVSCANGWIVNGGQGIALLKVSIPALSSNHSIRNRKDDADT
jgi:hypothetical protein